MGRSYGNFVPQAKAYDASEYSMLTPDQKSAVQRLKIEAGWISGNTPPQGFHLNNEGLAEPSHSIISAIQSVIGQTTATPFTPPPLPPAPIPNSQPPILPVINTLATQAGQSFGRHGTRVTSDNSTNSQVLINGVPYGNPIFNSNGNRIA